MCIDYNCRVWCLEESGEIEFGVLERFWCKRERFVYIRESGVQKRVCSIGESLV